MTYKKGLIKMWNLLFPVYFSPENEDGGGSSGSGEQNTDNSGTQAGTANAIDWSKIDPNTIPENVLKQNKAYTKTLDESINRRKEIKTLKDAISKLQTEEETQTAPTNSETENTQNPVLAELERQLKTITERLSAQDAENLNAWRKMAGERTGIKSEFILNNLQGKNFDELLTKAQDIAKELGISPPPSETGSLGNPVQQKDASFREAVKRRMTGGDAYDPYDPNFHKAAGGGYSD
jgi:hypothetical protein